MAYQPQVRGANKPLPGNGSYVRMRLFTHFAVTMRPFTPDFGTRAFIPTAHSHACIVFVTFHSRNTNTGFIDV